jgi:hypothetical protein
MREGNDLDVIEERFGGCVQRIREPSLPPLEPVVHKEHNTERLVGPQGQCLQ